MVVPAAGAARAHVCMHFSEMLNFPQTELVVSNTNYLRSYDSV
jgi:hypothetical protein